MPASEAPDHKSVAESGRRYTILVIEEDVETRQVLQRLLREAGFDLLMADHEAQAHTLLATHTADLIITDLKLPLTLGEQLIEALRQKPACAGTPIVVLTPFRGAFGDVALRAGATVVLQKPREIVNLVETANQLLGRSGPSSPE